MWVCVFLNFFQHNFTDQGLFNLTLYFAFYFTVNKYLLLFSQVYVVNYTMVQTYSTQILDQNINARYLCGSYRGGSFSQKIESANPRLAKLSGLTPGISYWRYCSVESAVS
jgi:hypothetical protein